MLAAPVLRKERPGLALGSLRLTRKSLSERRVGARVEKVNGERYGEAGKGRKWRQCSGLELCPLQLQIWEAAVFDCSPHFCTFLLALCEALVFSGARSQLQMRTYLFLDVF